jgi:riboflavin kinase/FMN adenylyltransferase
VGHRRILDDVRLLAGGIGVTGVVVTFDPHPMAVLQPEEPPRLLTLMDERIDRIREAGIEEVVVLRFTPELAGRSAEWFVKNILMEKLNMRRLVIGYDFGFGKGREGDASYLESLGEAQGFGVDIVPPVRYLGHPVSSTRVRTALVRGDAESAAAMLGRAYSFEGRVVKGEGRGRKLDCPTANLRIPDARKMLPASGVYAAKVDMRGGSTPGVLYLGTKPTFGGGRPSIEVHVLGLKGSLYGRRLRVHVFERLRAEASFSSAADLRAAIDRDIERARIALGI